MIYIVNGFPKSGKDEFCLKVKEVMGIRDCAIFSTVDVVKSIARTAGWTGEKTPENRKFLSDLKDLLTEWDDVPMKDINRKIEIFLYNVVNRGGTKEKAAVFIMCREPKEIQRLKEKYGAKTVVIRRESAENQDQSNHADSEVLNYSYDITINNNGSLLALAAEAIKFVETEGLYRNTTGELKIDFFGKISYNYEVERSI